MMSVCHPFSSEARKYTEPSEVSLLQEPTPSCRRPAQEASVRIMFGEETYRLIVIGALF